MIDSRNIVFRLRFAVALGLGLALALSLFAGRAHAQEPEVAEYIVQMEGTATPAQGRAIVAELGGQVTSPDLPVINGFGAALQDDAAEELSTRPGVADVTLNGSTTLGDGAATSGGERCPAPFTAPRTPLSRVSDLDVSPLESLALLRQPLQVATGADRAWRAGLTGQGVGIAVVDTGIAGDLPDFAAGSRSRVIASVVTNPCASDADDRVGHGTHVAGLIAGNSLNDPEGRRLRGRYMGIAPRANLISVKVADDTGDTTVLDVINGLQFVVDHRAQFGIRVVNLSLSSTVAESYKVDPLAAAAEAAWFAGIVVVAAAGNDGAAPGAVSYAPGNDPHVITAGALDDKGTSRLDDDEHALWSSRGVTQDGFKKPDVIAPGTKLVAPLAPRGSFAKLCRKCVVARKYFRLSGTSMSTAVVSGAAALMLERNPGLTPDQVKGAMVGTLRAVRGQSLAIDAYAALAATGATNHGLAPNNLIDPATGTIDWARASFRRASFRDASGSPFGALWTRASFRCDCGLDASGQVDPARASFRRVSFRRNVEFDR